MHIGSPRSVHLPPAQQTTRQTDKGYWHSFGVPGFLLFLLLQMACARLPFASLRGSLLRRACDGLTERFTERAALV